MFKRAFLTIGHSSKMDSRDPNDLHDLLYDAHSKKAFYRSGCKLRPAVFKCKPDCPPVVGPRGPPGPAQLNVGNTVYVDSVFGSDVTGALQDEAKPFRTLGAVSLAALPGYLVVVRPGTYAVTTNLATVDNISWYFPVGTFIDTVVTMFDTVGLSYFSLSGEGVFRSTAGQSVISLRGVRADLAFQEISATLSSGISIASGEVTVHGGRILSSSPGPAFSILGGVSYVTLDKVENSNGASAAASAVNVTNDATPGGELYTYIEAAEILAGAGQAVFYSVRTANPNRVSHITGDIIRSNQNSALAVSGGRLFANADLVISGGAPFATVLISDAIGGSELSLECAWVNKLSTGPVIRSIFNSALSLICNRISADLGGSIEIQSGGNMTVDCTSILGCNILCQGTGLMFLNAEAFLGRRLLSASAISAEDSTSLTLSLKDVLITSPLAVTMFLRSSTTGLVRGNIMTIVNARGGILEMTGDNTSDFTFGSIENNSLEPLPSFDFRSGQHTLRWNSFTRQSIVQPTSGVVQVGGGASVDISGQLSRTNSALPMIQCFDSGSLVYDVAKIETVGDIVLVDAATDFDLTFNSLLAISGGRLASIRDGRDITFSGLSRVGAELPSIDFFGVVPGNFAARNLTLANTAPVRPLYSVTTALPVTLGVFGVLTVTRPLGPLVSPLPGTIVYQNNLVR